VSIPQAKYNAAPRPPLSDQPDGSGGAFVTQVPAGAKLRPPPAAKPRARFVAADLLHQNLPEILVEVAALAVLPYVAGQRPSLPYLTEGAGAALATPAADAAVPRVGTGLVN
jgi:hypothetical protein